GDLVSVGLRGEHEACAHELPVEDDRARPALALLASVLRSGQPEALAQGEEEALSLPHVGLASLPVDRQRDLHATVHLSIARVASTRSACRRYAAVPRTSSIGLAAATTRSANPSSSPVTSAATGPDEPKAARASLRSRSTLSASEHTAITIAFLGPTSVNVSPAPSRNDPFSLDQPRRSCTSFRLSIASGRRRSKFRSTIRSVPPSIGTAAGTSARRRSASSSERGLNTSIRQA